MKSILKHILTAAVLLFALVAPLTVKAQTYSFQTLSQVAPTVAAATTTTYTNAIVDCRAVQTLAIAATLSFSGSTTSNAVYTFGRSVDRLSWETANQFTWTIAGNGTTPTTQATNITVGGFGWIKLISGQNTHASLVLTNNGVVYGLKVRAP